MIARKRFMRTPNLRSRGGDITCYRPKTIKMSVKATVVTLQGLLISPSVNRCTSRAEIVIATDNHGNCLNSRNKRVPNDSATAFNRATL